MGGDPRSFTQFLGFGSHFGSRLNLGQLHSYINSRLEVNDEVPQKKMQEL